MHHVRKFPGCCSSQWAFQHAAGVRVREMLLLPAAAPPATCRQHSTGVFAAAAADRGELEQPGGSSRQPHGSRWQRAGRESLLLFISQRLRAFAQQPACGAGRPHHAAAALPAAAIARPLPPPGAFRYWVDYQAFSSPESALLPEAALMALGGVRTGGPPKLDPMTAARVKIRDYGYMHMDKWDLLLSITAKAMLAAEVRPGPRRWRPALASAAGGSGRQLHAAEPQKSMTGGGGGAVHLQACLDTPEAHELCAPCCPCRCCGRTSW